VNYLIGAEHFTSRSTSPGGTPVPTPMRHSAVPASWRATARQPVPLAAMISRRTPGLGEYVRASSEGE